MLTELVNFTRHVRTQCGGPLLRNLQPREGIHISVKIEEGGNIKYCAEFYRENQELTGFLQECLKKEIHTRYISSNKALDFKKKIHSASPFCVAFKIKTKAEVSGRFDEYFDSATIYCENDEQKKWAQTFRNFCNSRLLDLITEVMEKIKAEKSGEKKFKFSDDHYIVVYLDNVSLEDYEITHKNYLRKKSFNTDEYNEENEGETYGVGDFLTGYNAKKPFLHHLTATFSINNRITNDEAIELFYFSQLLANKQLPNPLPVFVDRDELNEQVVKVFNKEGEGRPGYQEIIRRVYEKSGDLGNYYLLNFWAGALKDFDFVPSFRYKIDPPIEIEEFFGRGEKLDRLKIEDIFAFEREIVQRIFNNQLVQKTKNAGIRYRYFDDIENKPQYIRPAIFHVVMRYRKSFYDYIYKSRRQAVTGTIFYDIMQTTVLDDLRQDDGHNKSFSIKEKLNIWFNLYNYFDKPLSEGVRGIMDELKNLHERIAKIANAKESKTYLANDQEFAYAAGQVIYYLLDRSEAGNKSHALLEPFLQKSNCEQFKMAIARTFSQYKHAIHFAKGRFENLTSQVLSYNTPVDMKTLLPMVLAGYFAKSIIYQKKEETTVNPNEKEPTHE